MAEEVKKAKNRYHVTKHPDGGWQVVLGGGEKVIRRTKTQAEALEIAKGFAENKQGKEKTNTTVYLHGRNGRIRDAESFKEVKDKKGSEEIKKDTPKVDKKAKNPSETKKEATKKETKTKTKK